MSKTRFNARKVLSGESGTGRQAEPAVEEILRHGPAVDAALPEGGLEVKRFPDGTRLDVGGGEAFAARPTLGAVPFPCAAPEESTRWLSVFLFPSPAARDAVAARLAAANVEARPVWKPLHLQPAFRKCRVYGGAVAEGLFNRGLCLPSGAGLTRKDLARIEACL